MYLWSFGELIVTHVKRSLLITVRNAVSELKDNSHMQLTVNLI